MVFAVIAIIYGQPNPNPPEVDRSVFSLKYKDDL
jgi:hypothetical protein